MVRVMILKAPGINCDEEMHKAFRLAGAETQEVLITSLIRDSSVIDSYDALGVPGGFCYGDDLGAGKILANQLRYKMYDRLHEFVDSGKPVIGVCNGFQILVKAGILPGITDSQDATLTFNDSGKFECRWIRVKNVNRGSCLWSRNLDTLELPVAHGEGKFVPRDRSVLKQLQDNNQIVFKYVDGQGSKSGYPHNPNGSVADIAGICNKKGNVLGMMPHPERYLSSYNHPRWTRLKMPEEGLGLKIYRNAVEYAEEHK